MRTSPRLVMAGLVAVILLVPLRAGAPQQIIPQPPAPVMVPDSRPPQPAALPPAVPSGPAMPPASEKPATVTGGTAPAFDPPVAQKLPPAGQAPNPTQTREVARQAVMEPKQVAPGATPADAPAAAKCPEELARQCREARAAELLYARQYYESQGRDLELRQQAFEWHAFSTKALFWCVITITGVGLALSWREFGKYYEPRLRKQPGPPGAAEPAAEVPPQSVVKVGAQGLEVTSSLIGFLVLSVSLAFFYLYVVNVYPLYELSTGQPTSAGQGDGTAAKK